MPTEIVNLLAQLPVVLLFVWFSDRMYKQFQEFLREERVARKEDNLVVVAAVKELSKEVHAALDTRPKKP